MRFRLMEGWIRLVTAIFLALVFSSPLPAQTGNGTLHGQVTDPSAAAVTDATILVMTPAGVVGTATTNRDGTYEVKDLPPGKYTVKAVAAGFAPYVNEGIEIAAAQTLRLNIALTIEAQKQKVEVKDETGTIDVAPSNNASTISISGKELEALSDDPDELQTDLEALAGPSAGPNGGQMYIDGFTAGQLPPKASIREIRINQNPFSAEYDKLGYGRIEIFTKPGTDNLHGQFFVSGNSSSFNSRNPFATQEPGYDSTQYSGNIGGPITKKASFFFNVERRNINDESIVNAIVLDPTLNPIPFSDSVANPRTRTNLGPRLDIQLGKNNTLTARYQYFRNNETNDGIGQFSLASQGYNSLSTEQTLQVSDTQIFGVKVVNETRFQYNRDRGNQTAQNTQPTINVLGSFTGGGSSAGNNATNTDHYELQNYTSMAFQKHFLKFGGRLRVVKNSNDSTNSFNGNFTFPSIAAFQAAEIALQTAATASGASQFSIIQGSPIASVALFDAGLYVQDDWRVRPNITLSYGLRFETQDLIHDHADLAPRLGIAWGIGKGRNSTPKMVLRAGFGMFYDRFNDNLILQAERLNGVTQQQFILNSPNFFPLLPTPAMLAGAQSIPTIYQIDPKLHSPYTMQSAISVERQINKVTSLSVNYLHSRGVHQLLTRNINAPLPGTFNPAIPTSGVRPLPAQGNIYQYESAGIFKENQLIANLTIRAGAKLSLFGYYTLTYANSDAAGASSFPSNQYNLRGDFGRASFDVRNRVFMGGTIAAPYGFRVSPFLVASSGSPFNVTLGQDLNGDSIFNDRPAFASSLSLPANVVMTNLGAFDTVPVAGEKIVPINFGSSAARFSLNMRLSKTFGFGKKAEGPGGNASGGGDRGGGERRGGGGGRGGGPFAGGGGMGGSGAASNQRYSLTFGVSGRNIFNNVNRGTPIGNLSSPLFDKSNGLAGGPYSSGPANRRVDLQMTFNF
jgi:hypothetical protein